MYYKTSVQLFLPENMHEFRFLVHQYFTVAVMVNDRPDMSVL
jgi:hypothetical protein